MRKETLNISIVFITMNRSTELIRAIKSCLIQKDVCMEIVIIDNASTDDTEEQIRNLNIVDSSAKIRYIKLKKNLGVAGARNIGFSKAKNEIVFFLDDDAVIKGEYFLKSIVLKFFEDSRCACIAPYIIQPEDGKELIGDVFRSSKNTKEMFSFIGAAHAIRKTYYDKVKLYPEKLVFGSEELYVSLYFRKRGFKIIYMDELKVLHIPSTINRYYGRERDYNINLNIYIIRKLFYPRILLPLLSFLFVIRSIKNRCFWPTRIIKDYKIRYNKNDIDRMNYRQFFSLLNNVPFWRII